MNKQNNLDLVCQLLEDCIRNNTYYSYIPETDREQVDINYYAVVEELSKQINFQIKPTRNNENKIQSR